MKIRLVYVCVSNGSNSYELAARFVGSFLTCPPMVDMNITVVCNGGWPERETSLLFAPLTVAATSCTIIPRANDTSWDLGAYYDIALGSNADMMVCCGESIFFHKPGWMVPLVEAWEKFGPGMYGSFTSNLVRPHLNTTGFVCAPKLITTYPKPKNRPERYDWEHGKNAFWRRLQSKKIPVALVTWDGVYGPEDWRTPDNILWRGTQENCLMHCNHTKRFEEATPEVRFRWASGADQPYRV